MMLQFYLKLFVYSYITVLLFAKCGSTLLICPSNITSFSIGPYENQYYACEEEGKTPTLRNCPENEVYWPVKERCSSMANRNSVTLDGNADLPTLTAPVLGNPVYLGCLYDATTHTIMAADSFWTRDTVQKNKVQSQSYSQHVQFYAATTMFERLNHMDLDVSLKLDFLDGKVIVEGSAAFLRDSVESAETVSIIMNSHYVTRTEMLPIATPLDYIKLCGFKGPTHVVTSITYGMDANFVFKKTATKDTSKQEIEGSLKIAVKSMPSVKIEGEGHLKISESLKKKIKGIDVKLYGDFVLDKQPTTYEESVRVFKELPSHLGTKPEFENASKMKMQLTPITRFCDAKTAILIGISDNLILTVTKMLDELERTKLKAKTLLISNSVNNYLQLKKILNRFVNSLSIFELEVKGELQTILPNIRGGGQNSSEKDLVAMFTKYRKSPFYIHTSENFLKVRAREIEMIDYILNPSKFKGTEVTILDFEKATDGKILFSKPYVTMVRYSILPSEDILDSFLQGKPVDESKSWFNDHEVLALMGETFRTFMNFANANRNTNNRGFLLALSNANETSVNVFAQRKGQILSSSFKLATAPPQMSAAVSMFNTIQFVVWKPDNKWVTGFTITYWKLARQEHVMERSFEFGSSNKTIANVTGLRPNELYQFSMRYQTVMGHGPSSINSDPIVTRPCSPPRNVHTKDVSSTSFIVQWDVPIDIGAGVDISSYEVVVHGNYFMKRYNVSSNECYVSVNGTPAASLLTATITAFVNLPKINESIQQWEIYTESAPAKIILRSAPNPPTALNLVAVSFHSADIKWNIAAKIADGAIIYDYLVKYVVMDNLGKEEYSGTEIVHSSNNKTSVKVQDLAEGATYGFTVKVVTSQGDSPYSSSIIVKTKYKETELDEIRNSVKIEIKDVVKEERDKAVEKIDAIRKVIKYQCVNPVYYPAATTSNRGQRCYEVGNATANFIGYGWYGTRDVNVYKNGMSLFGCVRWCYEKRESDRAFDGFFYHLSGSTLRCGCYKNGRGTFYTNNYHLYYKWSM